jgi:hypothetical protein
LDRSSSMTSSPPAARCRARVDADDDLGQLCRHGHAFSPHRGNAAGPGPVRRGQDCDGKRQRQLAVRLLIRPTSPAGPVPVTAGGQVRREARSQSAKGSRPRLPTVSPSPMH